MKKLSRDGYTILKSDFNSKELKIIKDDLTAKPYTMDDFSNGKEKKFYLYLESPKKLYLPRFYGLNKFGKPDIDKIDDGDSIDINFKGELRKEQKPIFDISYKQIIDTGGGIVSLKCGGGKTVLALYILSQIRMKTLVVVHKDFLMTQWYDRILEFIPDAKIGKIQQNTIDIEGKDIILAMVQSLSMKEYPENTFKSFGLVIFDECHHLGAEVFSKCMAKVQSKYMLGLSATPNRKDGLRKVFEWYIGDIAYMTKDTKDDDAIVNIIKYYSDDQKYSKVETTFQGKPCVPRMINNICNHTERTLLIIKQLLPLYKEGRCILILSDRRNHLLDIENGLKKHDIECGYYVGGMKPQGLRDAQEKNVILGTFSMASEGMDIPKLNTMILASPKSDIVQSVGRILRQKKETRMFVPLIVDINDEFSTFKNQSKKRLVYYNRCKYDINIYDLDGTNYKYTKKKKKKEKKIIDIDECLI
jgi:superfamily II DNA or RNA helicase